MGCGAIFCALLVALAVGLSYRFVGSLNPFRVYSSGTETQIVVISTLCAFTGLLLLSVMGQLIQSAISGSRDPDPRVLHTMSLSVVTALILGCAYWRTGSLNPIDVFRMGGVLWPTVTALLIAMLSLGLVQFAFIVLLIWRIESDSNNSYRDVYCKLCDDRLLVASGLKWKKTPFKCPHCGEWIHTECWREAGGSLLSRCKDEKCRQQGVFNDLDDILRRLQ